MGVFTQARMAREHFGEILARRAQAGKGVVPGKPDLIASPGGSVNGRVDVGNDSESLATLLVGACVSESSDLWLDQAVISPVLAGVIEILHLMGADITTENQRQVGGESVADLRVRHAVLTAVDIPEALVSQAIDEFPVLLVAAACAQGRTVWRCDQELRAQQLDRIQAMADGLSGLGVTVEITLDGIIIEGGSIRGGEVQARGDHGIAMALSIASLRATAPILIHDCANVATSFPGFLAHCAQVGIRVAQEGQS
jgi:3-phosphoshikimate 1-carboxyvinyltransferase